MRLCLSLFAFLFLAAEARAADLRVAASILPLHALASAVMEGAGAPNLIIQPTQSEHHYAARPSDAKLIQSSDLVLWVGPALEHSLAAMIKSSARPGSTIQADGLQGLTLRRVGSETKSTLDPHIWLNPANGLKIAREVAERLASLDPARASLYRRNFAAFELRINAVDQDIAGRLAPVARTPFLVYHDAIGYFSDRYGLAFAGTLSRSAEQQPGAKRLNEIRGRIQRDQIRCVFAEPQMPARNVEVVIEGTAARRGIVDGIGASVTPGPRAYDALLTGLAISLRTCLEG